MLVSLTVGKVDAGVTVLLTQDKRLIEFPSILLPPDITSGSIVDITVSRNTTSEQTAEQKFRALQDQIFSSFGAAEPTTPVLRCRNATQTSVVLEWDPIELATADLIGLALYRNGQKAGNIPRPLGMHSTKISGLAVDTPYTFHLVLRTSAGTYASEKVEVRTHKMTDLSGITITTGLLQPASIRDTLSGAVERIGCKMVDTVRIDTTHFVTTEGRGLQWEKAVEMNIPVVRPEWVEACEKNGRILGVTKFYLDAPRQPPSESQTPVDGGRPAAAERSMSVQSQSDKNLPAEPASAGGGNNGQAATSENAAADSKAAPNKETAVDGEEGNDNDDDESDENEPVEAKARAAEEQKSRVEDKKVQNLAVRPGPSTSKGEASDGEEKPPSVKAESFQDVAL